MCLKINSNLNSKDKNQVIFNRTETSFQILDTMAILRSRSITLTSPLCYTEHFVFAHLQKKNNFDAYISGAK